LQAEVTDLDAVEVKEPESAGPAAPMLLSSPDKPQSSAKLSETRSFRKSRSMRGASPSVWSNPIAFAEAVEAQKKTANLRNQHHFPESAKWYIIPPHVRTAAGVVVSSTVVLISV
jgi:hypothetical protein